MRLRLLLPAFCTMGLAAITGCSGTTPKLRGVPEQGISAVIVAGRFIVPTGETQSGRMAVNLEGEGGRQAEVYRIPIKAHNTLLYQVEPGLYHLSPTRNLFGFYQPILKVRVEDATYRIAFPRDILRKAALDIKPKKIMPIGIFDVQLQQALPGQKPTLKLHLDDSVDARRKIVQDIIHDMMDPQVPVENRESAISWTRALQNSLMELLSETERTPLFKAAP